MSRLGLGLGLSKGRAFSPFDPLSLNPILAYDMQESMMAPLASESLDLDPANPSTLDIITATRAGTATYTDASGNIQTASPNTVRVDHVDGVPMMLIEPAATNTARYSESAINYNYSNGVTHETTNILAPNGQASAFKITPDGSNSNTVRSGSSYTYSGAYNPSDIVTMSVWLKADGYDYFVSVGGFFGGESALFDTIDGSNVSNDANVISASSEDYGNGWYRYKVTYTFQNQIGNSYLYAGVRIRKRDASGNPISNFVTGETTGILVYGTQFELGSVATSYIPTDNDNGGVTRAADDLVIDGSDFTNFYNQSEGTIYIEWQREATNTVYPFTISDGGSGNYIRINNASTCRIKTGSSEQANFFLGSSNTGQINRAAVSFAANNFDGSKNGGAVVSDSAGTPPTVNQLQIGGLYNQGSEINGHIKRLIYWPHHSDNL